MFGEILMVIVGFGDFGCYDVRNGWFYLLLVIVIVFLKFKYFYFDDYFFWRLWVYWIGFYCRGNGLYY